ncbi:MAG: hypothetical protein ABJH06_19230 [Paraglaciecola sp.]|uniref:hypothetical protein n=1 Tax=Paraglaciecola sp. TaxID=1920173 RepID=UPI003299E876
MKISYWIATTAIIITFVTAFAIGYVTGQNGPLKSKKVTNPENTWVDRETTSENLESTSNSKINTETTLALNSASKVFSTMDEVGAEVSRLLAMLVESPNHSHSTIKLYAILETLSVAQLMTLASMFEDEIDAKRNTLNKMIISLLIEKAPNKALAFAQEHISMPDFPYYLASIKAKIAEKNPELGFEFLNQMLGLSIEEIDLSKNTALIQVLAKADLKQLVSVLAEFKNMGVNLKNSMFGLSYGLKTDDDHLNLFNELRQLNDMSILSSVLMSWVKISPDAVFARLGDIENIIERKELSDTAFHYWMYNEPEAAADYHLANSSNKLKTIKDIMRTWPDAKASNAMNWLSAQNDIDVNRYKIDYLNDLSRTEPKFVQTHLDDINLNDDEIIDFYKRLYNGLNRKSSSDAEQFLNTLTFKDEIVEVAPAEGSTAEKVISTINEAFRKYFDFKYDKAFALAIADNGGYAYSYVVNKSSQNQANDLALSLCEQRRHKFNVVNQCRIYAEGDVTLFNLTL